VCVCVCVCVYVYVYVCVCVYYINVVKYTSKTNQYTYL
jgi:hypothetical protein